MGVPLTFKKTTLMIPMKKKTDAGCKISDSWKTSECRRVRGNAALSIPAPSPTFSMIAERGDNNLFIQCWIGNKPCLVTIYTGASVTIAKTDITAE
jgi:hypothetical protein